MYMFTALHLERLHGRKLRVRVQFLCVPQRTFASKEVHRLKGRFSLC